MKKNPHAAAMGRKTSDRKTAAARLNGRLGGRPRKDASAPGGAITGQMSIRDRVALAGLLKAIHDQLAIVRGKIAPGDDVGVRVSKALWTADDAFEWLTGRPPADVADSDLDINNPAGWVVQGIRKVRAIVRA